MESGKGNDEEGEREREKTGARIREKGVKNDYGEVRTRER